MHQAVDGRCRCHLIAEDAIPVREDQIARNEDGASLIAFGEEREENLGLLGALLDVAHIVQDQHGKVIEFAKRARQIQIPFRGQELLDQAIGRHEEHRVPALDQRVADAHRAWLLPTPSRGPVAHALSIQRRHSPCG